jgi:hypothetical protein
MSLSALGEHRALPLGEGLRARRNGHSTASVTDAGTLGSRNKEQY